METTYSPVAPELQSKDVEHLRLLSTFHYIVAGIGALFACIPLVHVTIGLIFMISPESMKGQDGSAPPQWFGLFFFLLGSVFVVLGWAAAICTFLSGRYIAKRRKRMFSVVTAAVLCVFFPFGTVLGVFSLIILSKPSVQKLYSDMAP